MIGAPLLILGVLVALSALIGARATGRRHGAVIDFLLSPIHPATWASVAAILVGLVVTALAFAIVVGLLSFGISVLVFVVGLVIVGATIEFARYVARIERARAGWGHDRPLLPHPYRPYGASVRDLALAVFLDMARWRDVLYV
ncbi:MAG TPA: sensor domain-containing protein, partial [Candidatus Limnocylindrales bacterium]